MNSHQQPAMQVVVSVVLQGGYHLSMPRAWQDECLVATPLEDGKLMWVIVPVWIVLGRRLQG